MRILASAARCTELHEYADVPPLQGVFGLGKKKKSPIGFERVVRILSSKRHKAPDQV